jgi:hypothetical protein
MIYTYKCLYILKTQKYITTYALTSINAIDRVIKG